MRLLLDTHILLWWLNGDRRLPRAASSWIAGADNTVFVSSVTMWEIWLKVSLGTLQVPEELEAAIESSGFESLPLLDHQCRGLARLPWHHRDPFDRMLLAQAQAAGLRLLTADAALQAYGDTVLLAR